MKSIRGEYYLNGHWTIEGARALPVASTLLHYERGAEGDLAPERLHARGPTSEPLVIEVKGEAGTWPPRGWQEGEQGGPLASSLNGDPPAQLISQEPNPGVHFEYHLPLGAPRPGFSWSHSSWGDCSAECGGGEGSGLDGGRCVAVCRARLSPAGTPAVGGRWTSRYNIRMSQGATLGKPRSGGTRQRAPTLAK